MIKVVLDTNALISALIKTGKPRKLIFELIRGKTQIILSKEILEEFARVSRDPKIRKYVDDEDIVKFLTIIVSIAKIVKIKSKFKVVKEDPSDDIILRTAHDGKANYIITGNEHLLSLKEFKGMKILNISKMLEFLK